MAEMSAGTALRNLQQAHATLKRARQALRIIRGGDDPEAAQETLRVGWEALARAHRLLADIPVAAANGAVMTKQLSVQRYATALLVRLRRLARNEVGDLGADEDEDFEDEA
jgi:hypothetical protein